MRAERSPEEARKLADAAAGALDAGEPFERVADRYGSESPSMRSVDRSQEGERVVFKAKANAKRQEPAFLVPARRAVVAEDAAFGFVVWYRVR